MNLFIYSHPGSLFKKKRSVILVKKKRLLFIVMYPVLKKNRNLDLNNEIKIIMKTKLKGKQV